MRSPPSTTNACPVMNEAASEHRNRIAAATSSGAPVRPWGIRAGSAGSGAVTRTPRPARSRAASRVRPMIPAWLAAKGALSGRGSA